MSVELPGPVRAAIDAVNANDFSAFSASFTSDGVVDDWGREFRGADIRSWSDAEFIGKNATLAVDSVEVVGADVTVIVQVGGDGFNGPSTFIFTVDGDLVSAMKIRA
ncbi:nuclear transport factor 2 family protein [Rhodococcus sp. I2R]|uniref:nuclear transport factor 2 family protein n=1 Tax=Rhodococcus sp. I2R TaxID=2855445 RepID=UPI001E63ED90|nr:nuclear transport factor 2 family protein [Rhodococcus sp. I2R]MCC8929811.1 nuclear transport factor 2 family protein [Rhodococcus sp. I2R]